MSLPALLRHCKIKKSHTWLLVASFSLACMVAIWKASFRVSLKRSAPLGELWGSVIDDWIADGKPIAQPIRPRATFSSDAHQVHAWPQPTRDLGTFQSNGLLLGAEGARAAAVGGNAGTSSWPTLVYRRNAGKTSTAALGNACSNGPAPVRTSGMWTSTRHWSHPTQVWHPTSKALFPSSCTAIASLEEKFRSCRHLFLLVLRWNKVENVDTFAKRSQDLLPFECCSGSGVTWLMTGNRSRLPEADVVEFWSGTAGGFPKRGKRDQLFLMFVLEGFVWKGPEFAREMKVVNLVRSYVLAGDLYRPYPPEEGCWEARQLQLVARSKYVFLPFSKRVPNAVASLIGHCGTYNNRSGVLKSLMRHVAMHHFGRCFHTHNLPPKERPWNQIAYSLGRYKVAVSMENTLCTDYISEKSLRYVMLGVIPLVSTWHGRPDYNRRMPNNHSVIDISDFPSADKVAGFLHRVMADEVLFDTFLAYRETDKKRRPDVSEEFTKRWLTPHADPEGWCPLAKKMVDPVKRERLRKGNPTIDMTCAPRGVQWNGPGWF